MKKKIRDINYKTFKKRKSKNENELKKNKNKTEIYEESKELIKDADNINKKNIRLNNEELSNDVLITTPKNKAIKQNNIYKN